MNPYIDISHNEEGHPEYSIHALGKDDIADIAAAVQMLQYMLLRKVGFSRFNGYDIDTEKEKRIDQIDALMQSIKTALSQTEK